MGKKQEIERKFLVGALPNECKQKNELNAIKKLFIRQGYISQNPTIRLRQQNDAFILAVKGQGQLSREEFEMNLDEEQFVRLWEKIESGIVSKTRYLVPIAFGLVAELDEYHGALEGLFTVEVEFISEEAANNFIPPSWFGKEVTYDSSYSNQSLARFGLPT